MISSFLIRHPEVNILDFLRNLKKISDIVKTKKEKDRIIKKEVEKLKKKGESSSRDK